MLQRGSTIFAEPKKFGCYLVVDRNSPASLACALRYWGCIIQAGAQVSGAFALASPNSSGEPGATTNDFSPLPSAFIPHISMAAQLDWNNIMQHTHSESARNLLTITANKTSIPPVIFDPANKTVTLLMPGFDKSEIKLYQVCIMVCFTFLHYVSIMMSKSDPLVNFNAMKFFTKYWIILVTDLYEMLHMLNGAFLC